MLQEELGAPIICTQPRRLAAVSIARHVANLVGSPLGRDVGFRIGQRAVASAKTKILFTTAGLLLEELRAQVRAVSALWRFCIPRVAIPHAARPRGSERGRGRVDRGSVCGA